MFTFYNANYTYYFVSSSARFGLRAAISNDSNLKRQNTSTYIPNVVNESVFAFLPFAEHGDEEDYRFSPERPAEKSQAVPGDQKRRKRIAPFGESDRMTALRFHASPSELAPKPEIV